MSTPSFLSPVSKLLRFFHKSRNQWKDKCKQAKKDVKSLKVRLAKMKASRDRWKQQALESTGAGTAAAETTDSTIKIAAARSADPSRRRRSFSAAGATGG